MPLKFSIESILRQPHRQCEVDQSGSPMIQINTVKKMKSEDTDDTPAATEPYSWLQTSRYNPPKISRNGRKQGPTVPSGKLLLGSPQAHPRAKSCGRSPRIPFTKFQVGSLEAKFQRDRYLSSSDVAEISQQLHLTETRVKIWFQNRRARERREAKPETDLLDSLQSPTGTPSHPRRGGSTDDSTPLCHPKVLLSPPTHRFFSPSNNAVVTNELSGGPLHWTSMMHPHQHQNPLLSATIAERFCREHHHQRMWHGAVLPGSVSSPEFGLDFSTGTSLTGVNFDGISAEQEFIAENDHAIYMPHQRRSGDLPVNLPSPCNFDMLQLRMK